MRSLTLRPAVALAAAGSLLGFAAVLVSTHGPSGASGQSLSFRSTAPMLAADDASGAPAFATPAARVTLPAASATATGSPTPATPFVPSPTPLPSDNRITINSVTDPVSIGGIASLRISTGREAACTPRYISPEDEDVHANGLVARKANETGVVVWSWRIPQTQPGTGVVIVTCGNATAGASFRIVDAVDSQE